ncbi:hypothetical protein RRG08_044741 [Elysia crispata]|uniref:Uncharacterized protein n=1 Tax=Elysia crispata TaxID=231223 RepID=A0AAE1DGC7_9GAST|nr:hypothetical protein RRG08_044741 [Elysia crispata]
MRTRNEDSFPHGQVFEPVSAQRHRAGTGSCSAYWRWCNHLIDFSPEGSTVGSGHVYFLISRDITYIMTHFTFLLISFLPRLTRSQKKMIMLVED